MKIFRLQRRCRQKICPTDRLPTIFCKTSTPYSIATSVCLLLATAQYDLKTAFKQVHFQYPADFQTPRAFRRFENSDFELFFSIYQLLASKKYTLAATQYIADRFSRGAGSRGSGG